MLQVMRDKMQGLIAGAIAIVIALTFALWGIQNYLHGGKSKGVAEVNGEEITQNDLHIAYEQAKRTEMMYMGKKGHFFDQKAQAKLKQDVLQKLIKQKVLFQAGKEMGLFVTKNQLLGIVSGMPIFRDAGGFSTERYNRFVRALFGSEQAFFDEVEKSFLHMMLEKGISGTAFILPYEKDYIKKILKQRRDFGYFMVSSERFIGKLKITDEDVQRYYDENQKEFLLPEKVSINYVELISEDLSRDIKPTKDQLREFYESNIASFSTPKKWRITRVLLPLDLDAKSDEVDKVKEKITAIASKNKDKKDFIAKPSSGMDVNTSWLTRANMPSDVLTQINQLKVGQVSDPFRTKEGYNVIKLLDVKLEKVEPYKDVAKKVKDMYEKKLAAKAFSEAADKLSDLTYTNPDSLDLAAASLGVKIKDTGLFVNSIGKDGILANAKVVKAAFSGVVLQQRYNSNLIEIDPGHVVVLRIKEYIPEKLQLLKVVKKGIVKKLKDKKAKNKANTLVEDLLKALRNGESVAKLSEKYKLKWNTVLKAKYGQIGKDYKLIDAAFGLLKPEDKKVSARKVELNGKYAVINLSKVYSDSSAKEDPKENGMLKSLPYRLGGFEYQTLVDHVMDNAKIKILEKSLEK